MQTVRGADGKHYGYRVAEFHRFLIASYGPPSVASSGSSISIASFKGKTGIIEWDIGGWSDATGHFTLWDGNAGLYEGTHHYFQDFRNSPPQPGAAKAPYLKEVNLWIC